MPGPGGAAGSNAPPNALAGQGGGIHIIDPRVDHTGNGGMGGSAIGGAAGGAAGGGGEPPPVQGTLELVAGRLGGPGNLDGVGTAARLDGAWYKAFDQDHLLFVNDDSNLRVVDLNAAQVTTLGKLPAGEDLFFQRGALYLVDLGDWRLLEISQADGHTTSTVSLSPARPDATLSDVTSWPDGDAMFWVSSDGKLLRVDTATGVITATAIIGFPAGCYAGASMMTRPSTMLVAVNGVSPPVNEVLAIDTVTAMATLVATVPADRLVLQLDPGGQFAALDGGSTMPIQGGVAPPFAVDAPITPGPHGSVVIADGDGIALWDRSSATLTWSVGLSRPVGPENLGPAQAVILSRGLRGIAVQGKNAYLTGALDDGLAVLDLTTNVVSSLTQASVIAAAAVLPAPDGTLYLSAVSDCSLRRFDPATGSVVALPSPDPRDCLSRAGGNPTNPGNHNWVKAGMTFLDGSLFVASQGVGALEQIDLATGWGTVHPYYGDLAGTGVVQNDGMAALAVGSDGLLYGVDGQYLYRFDDARQTATIIGPGSVSVAADRQGHVYTTDRDTVLRYDIATGRMRAVAGVPGSVGVLLGPLPGSLNAPLGLAVTDGGDLLIGNTGEQVILRAHFQ